MLKLAYLLAVLLVINGAAEAHSWYPRDCCHDADCRPVPCAELVATRNGLMWRGAVIFNDQQIKASQDESCHVCAKAQQNAIVPLICRSVSSCQRRPADFSSDCPGDGAISYTR